MTKSEISVKWTSTGDRKPLVNHKRRKQSTLYQHGCVSNVETLPQTNTQSRNCCNCTTKGLFLISRRARGSLRSSGERRGRPPRAGHQAVTRCNYTDSTRPSGLSVAYRRHLILYSAAGRVPRRALHTEHLEEVSHYVVIGSRTDPLFCRFQVRGLLLPSPRF